MAVGLSLMVPGGGGLSDSDLSSATATPSDVYANKTFYAGNDTLKSGTMNAHSAYTASGTVTNDGNYIYYTFPTGAYLTKTEVGYPEITGGFSEIARVSGITGSKIVPGHTVAGVSSTVTTKGAESRTITPGGAQQSYTFQTAGKYCTGNMTVTVPAFSYGTNIYHLNVNVAGKGGDSPCTSGITVGYTGTYKIYIDLICYGSAAIHFPTIRVYVNGAQRATYGCTSALCFWELDTGLAANDVVTVGGLPTDGGAQGLVTVALR